MEVAQGLASVGHSVCGFIATGSCRAVSPAPAFAVADTGLALAGAGSVGVPRTAVMPAKFPFPAGVGVQVVSPRVVGVDGIVAVGLEVGFNDYVPVVTRL